MTQPIEPAADVTGGIGGHSTRQRRAVVLLVCVLCATLLLNLLVLSSTRFGDSYDDCFYVTAAKSLATGEGYRNINLPIPTAQILIPPLYPFLLSLVWRTYPHFPDNVVLLMLFSVAAMLGFIGLTWRYLIAQEYATPVQALVVVALAAINWRMMLLATSVISDVLFAMLTVIALHAAEKYEKSRGPWITVATALAVSLVVLTRMSGLVLLAAIAVYYGLHRKWKKALLPVVVGALFVAGWLGWCYLNSSGGEGPAYYASYFRGINVTMGKLEALNQTSSLEAHLKIIETNAIGLILVWAPLESLGLRSSTPVPLFIAIIILFHVFVAAGFIRAAIKRIRLLHIYFVFYFILHLLVPSHSYERYLIPVVPFLLLFLVSEGSVFVSTLKRELASARDKLTRVMSAFLGTALAALAAASLYINAAGIFLTIASAKQTVASAEDARTFEWIKLNTDRSDVLVCFSDLKYYLYTGRKAVRSVPVPVLDTTVYQAGDTDPSDLVAIFLDIVIQNNAKYFVFSPADFETQAPAYGKSIEDYLQQHPNEFVLSFQSPERRTRVYRIEGTVSLRVEPSKSSRVQNGPEKRIGCSERTDNGLLHKGHLHRVHSFKASRIAKSGFACSA